MDLGTGTSEHVASVSPLIAPLRAQEPQAGSALADAELMVRYRDGDARAFETLYQRHKAPLYRYLQRMCRRQEVANDLFQEVWSKLIATRERYEVRAQFTTFLFRIAHNSVIDYLRRAEHRYESGVDDAFVEEQLQAAKADRPDAQLSELQLRRQFRRALDALPQEQRDVFILYEDTGLSLEEIGNVTGVPMETAKSRLRYAVSKLRAALAQHQAPLYSSIEP